MEDGMFTERLSSMGDEQHVDAVPVFNEQNFVGRDRIPFIATVNKRLYQLDDQWF
eukprot:m.86655 g.86655  ORF g.86655 m.86655 type:complete len:55 (+) comp13063_c0_seq1:1301-1465(+)